jgi:Ca2+-binding EF-hand superfamily protein
MLLTLQKVDKTDIEDIIDLFQKLDKDGSGSLTVNDIALISNQTAKLRRKSIRVQQNYSSSRKILSLR